MTIYIPLEKLHTVLSVMNKQQLSESFIEYITQVEKTKTFEKDVIKRIAVYLKYGKQKNTIYYKHFEQEDVMERINLNLYESYNGSETVKFVKELIDIAYGRHNLRIAKPVLNKVPKLKENTPKRNMLKYIREQEVFEELTDKELTEVINKYTVIKVVDTINKTTDEKLVFVLTDLNSSLPFMGDDNKYKMIVNGVFNEEFLKGERIKNIKARSKKAKGFQVIEDTQIEYDNKHMSRNGLFHHIEGVNTSWWAFSNPSDKRLFVSSDSNLVLENKELDFIYKHVYFDFSFLKKYSLV